MTGIGSAFVHVFWREATNVAYCIRTIPDPKQYESLCSDGSRTVGTAVDGGNATQLKERVEAAVKSFDGLDVAIPNDMQFAHCPRELGELVWFRWTTHIPSASTNSPSGPADFHSSVGLNELYVPHLKQSNVPGGGRVVTVNRISEHEGDAFTFGQYAEAALLACNNTVSPGNPMLRGRVWDKLEQTQPEFYKKFLNLNPTGRTGKREVANVIVFLVGSVSAFTPCANLKMDGALHKGVSS
ncbi:hypothetical protein K437DRAFT_269118 [Tilletiaria anomala UBC 951]|uniref:NAD(P)-binding protein n=1 Tax=Tilletiaria anomala (strain ATCC 24038 / CBS 436.72 / UBC 951) TaxID=1037660 RepID=A0A066VPP1_TILAU|nr:uncharacterized protein K437DRAFT_269118 [Tilletiaria anomala UBC 951]KDN43416.1 hypothetical protein K437DRAFT_269118 [Tilletiaria anomala UBC 951]